MKARAEVIFLAFVLFATVFHSPAQAAALETDEGFRWDPALQACALSSEPGHSKRWLGPCGDLSDSAFISPDWTGLSAPGLLAPGIFVAHARATGADFSHAEFRHSNWDSSTLQKLKLESADLRGALFRKSDLSHSVLAHALLRGALIESSSFRSADLGYADLRRSHWLRSDLRGADLRGSDLRDSVFLLTHLEGAKYDSTTRLPFNEARAQALGMRRVPR